MSVRAVLLWLRYVAILAREIWWSSIAVAKLVLGPIDRLRSGFIALPMDARTDLEITTLANSITLTPGTLTVHVEPSLHTIIIHAIDMGHDPEDVRRSIRTVLEDNILRWTRAGSGKKAER
jgi:multicomponent Na+:H+ antiporter subunit E